MSKRSEDGFALVAALWALVLVGTVAVSYLGESRQVVRVNDHRNTELRARYAALAGLERAQNVLERLEALSRDAVTQLDPESLSRLIAVWNNLESAFAELRSGCLDTGCYELRVRDLGTALNVNLADEGQLRRFFVVLGIDAREADIAAQSIADWIDVDDAHRGRGAEREYYMALPFPYAPRNGPIVDLWELRRVRGVTNGLLDRAKPHLAVDGAGKINVNAAPKAVLAALPGVGEEALNVVLDARSRGIVFANAFELTQLLTPQARSALQEEMSRFMRLAEFEPRELEIQSTGHSADSSVRVTYRAIYVRVGGRTAQVKRVRLER
jgi:general secretion pathway protein K